MLLSMISIPDKNIFVVLHLLKIICDQAQIRLPQTIYMDYVAIAITKKNKRTTSLHDEFIRPIPIPIITPTSSPHFICSISFVSGLKSQSNIFIYFSILMKTRRSRHQHKVLKFSLSHLLPVNLCLHKIHLFPPSQL